MKKFILLYLGQTGLVQSPITLAALEKWVQQTGGAVVDRGSLLWPSGISVVDTGNVAPAPFPLYGYSVVQADSIESATALLKEHPFLANGKEGNFEIEVIELAEGDIPVQALETTPNTDFNPFANNPPSQTQQPTSNPPQPNNTSNGELNVPHNQGPGQTINPSGPGNPQQPTQ